MKEIAIVGLGVVCCVLVVMAVPLFAKKTVQAEVQASRAAEQAHLQRWAPPESTVIVTDPADK